MLTRSGDITPGITRREESAQAFNLADDIRALSGRVHAVVRTRPPQPLEPRAATQPL